MVRLERKGNRSPYPALVLSAGGAPFPFRSFDHCSLLRSRSSLKGALIRTTVECLGTFHRSWCLTRRSHLRSHLRGACEVVVLPSRYSSTATVTLSCSLFRVKPSGTQRSCLTPTPSGSGLLPPRVTRRAYREHTGLFARCLVGWWLVEAS